MNGFDFNKMTNKEKMEFIKNNDIELICNGKRSTRMFFYYNEHTDFVTIEDEILEESYEVLNVEFCGNNQLKVEITYGIEGLGNETIYLDCFIYKKAFNEDGSFNNGNKETISEFGAINSIKE